jgi:hypothetical protein
MIEGVAAITCQLHDKEMAVKSGTVLGKYGIIQAY